MFKPGKPSGNIPPLLLFIAVGALLFALDSWRSDRSEEQKISITQGKIVRMEEVLTQRYGHRPSGAELQAEVDAFIDEELLYREALKLGVHLSDEVVRRRMAQTMAFIIEGAAGLEDPSDSDLRELYEQRQSTEESTYRYTFEHIFFSSDQRKGRATQEAANALLDLRSGSIKATQTGDPFLLGQNFRSLTLERITDHFGSEFASAIVKHQLGQWTDPVTSKFGSHLLFIQAREPTEPPTFVQQRPQLIEHWRTQRRAEILQQAVAKLRQQFTIEIQDQRLQQVGQP